VSNDWNPTKNLPLTPLAVTPGSNKKIWWQCSRDKEHVWLAGIINRTKGSECPICNSLATLNPLVSKEWHPTRNNELTPFDVTPGSGKKVWWKCSVDNNHDKAIDSTRELLAQYLAQQPHIAKASGVSMDIVTEIQSILGWPATHEEIQKAKHLVPDELIYRITASGTPDEAKRKVNEYISNGCTCPILYPVGGNVKLLIDTFA